MWLSATYYTDGTALRYNYHTLYKIASSYTSNANNLFSTIIVAGTTSSIPRKDQRFLVIETKHFSFG